MAEGIELNSFLLRGRMNSDIEEYHEVNHEHTETTFSPNPSTARFVKEFDFFAEHDVKIAHKSTKKKLKQNDKTPSLMEIISSELASVALPVRENVILKMDVSAAQQNSFLEHPKIFQRRPAHFDTEYGWGEKPGPITLRPVFPKVLKNTEANNYNPIEVQYVEPTMFNDLVADNELEQKGNMKFLDIELNNINFIHHHKFSLEKLLCVKLVHFYKQYISITKSLNDLDRDIKINRETRDSLKKDLLEVSPDKTMDIRFDTTVRKYTGKLIELKESYRTMLLRQKEIIHKMIILWCDIEMLREKTEHKETGYNLMIAKETLDQEVFDSTRQECFKLEYSDMLDELEYEYVNRYLEYKEVKHVQNLDDSAKRKISKPRLLIDEEVLKEEIEEKVNNIVEKENYQLFLTEDQSKTNIDTTSKGHRKTEYFCEIYVDDIFVCQSERVSAKNKHEFSIEFTELFSVQILPKNMILTITLNENGRVVSSATIDLANVKKSYSLAEYDKKLFVYNDIIEPNVKHVGSGHSIKDIASHNKVRLKSSNLFKGSLYTACEINTKVGWSEKVIQTQSEVIKSSIETGRQIKRLLQGIDKPSTGDLIDIITKVYEKEISKDENIVSNLLNICKTEFKEEDTFPIDVNSPDVVRLKLLHLRNIGAFTDIEDKVIPVYASQISTEHLNCLQKSNIAENSYLSDRYSDMDPIEVQRFIGSKYVQQLNKNLLKNLNEHLLRKTHKDVVRDFKDLSLRSLFSKPTLLLSSLSSSTRLQLLAEALAKQQTIRVTVLRAYNLPQRHAGIEESGEEIAGFRVHPLRPMVRVSYRGHATTTATALGCQPTWSQTLQINTRLDPLLNLYIDVFDEYKDYVETEYSSDYQESSRQQQAVWLGGVTVPLRAAITQPELRGIFKLTCPPAILGYETPSQAKESTHSLIPEINRIMRKDATFLSLHITTSLAHLGGFECYSQPNEDDDYIIKHLNAFVTEYTNEFPSRSISLTFIDSSGKHKSITQFLQPMPLPDYEYFPKNPKQRVESALSKSSMLSKSSSSKSSDKKREGDPTYLSGEEKESLYSAVSWKNEEDQLNKLMEAAARYVSLIPTYEVAESHTVTLLGFELLKVIHGSPVDHSLLLWGYFHSLGLKVYVAMGCGTRGFSGYVFTAYDHSARRNLMTNDRLRSRGLLTKGDGYVWYVWDAATGERSDIRDAGCPLKTVHLVFDSENIWVNMQTSLDCESVSFDFTKSSAWRQVFPRSMYVPRPPSATPDPYRPPADGERLRLALENRLKDKIQRWRTHTKTVWNRYCSSVLRESLPHWEYWALHRAGPKPAAGPRLKQLMASYRVVGFPLNMAYTSSAAVVQAVKRQARAACIGAEVELALAVAVWTYPNSVASVWVYLATIARL